jgi:hypothetical protein
MNMRAIAAVITGTLLWGASAAQAQITTNLVPGNFTYQFADHTTGAPITSLNFTSIGQTLPVDVYLLQTGGVPPNLLQQLGAEALGVRLIYNGTVARVPGGTATIVNQNIIQNPNFDLIGGKGGSTSTPPDGSQANNTTDTSTNAALTEGILSNPSPSFPGPEDPLNNPLRILIGTFKFTSLASGQQITSAIDPYSVGNSNLSGPNPSTAPPDGFHGEILLDQYLSQYAAVPVIPTLTITVPPVPEPGTMALCGLAGVGFAAWRRRQKKATPTVAA